MKCQPKLVSKIIFIVIQNVNANANFIASEFGTKCSAESADVSSSPLSSVSLFRSLYKISP